MWRGLHQQYAVDFGGVDAHSAILPYGGKIVTPTVISCRYCRSQRLHRVLDLGAVPAADHFPGASSAPAKDALHPLAMVLCTDCALAQLEIDDTDTEEPRAVEPQALRDQAADAVARVEAAGLLTGRTVYEFTSPHGGSWLNLLFPKGFEIASAEPADLVLDSFGMMHDRDQADAIGMRARRTSADGVLLLQFHSIATILRSGQWNSLRHGHFAYYSLTVLRRMLADVGMSVVAVWEFDLYGGTLLVAARHGEYPAPPSVEQVLAREKADGAGHSGGFVQLQQAVDQQVQRLTHWLDERRAAGHTVYAYGAPSRAVALFHRAGLTTESVVAVADASVAKQGRRMPGTDIPIVSPADLVTADPAHVLLTLPDLYEEVRLRFPELEGRWMTGLC
ncbi:class I SAM-dependent methyltransferase [Mycobacteroides salmoniphilum]|uniref:class I SAM-dependent methyltransferase n=1 Tax=Mycobacteroides salmoniphilum TaxID=404941 RepID=UPI00106592FF|nr:class I SAM-dependent methyltransferase [Mycobacteroides salmoniphilum]